MTQIVSTHPPPSEHPWPTGYIFQSPGAHLTYRVIGPCCQLFDREQLPWPCCRLQWRGKEPSWRRIGARFTVDLATKCHPSYCVEIIGQGYRAQPIVITLYTNKLSQAMQHWWHTKRRYLEQVTLDTAIARGVEKTQLESPQHAQASPEILR